MSTNPEQASEIDAGGRGRCRVEHVQRIDERHQFATSGGGGNDLKQQAGAAGRT